MLYLVVINIGGCNKHHPASLFHHLQATMARSHQPSADVATPRPLRSAVTSLRQVCTRKVNISAMCNKTLLCDLFLDTCPGRKLRAYVILDEQANGTVLDERALNYFNISLATATDRLGPADSSHNQTKIGQRVTGLCVQGVIAKKSIRLHDVLPIQNLIDSRKQVVTPDMAKLHEHVAPFAHNFPPFDNNAEVLLRIGVDNQQALSTHVPVPDVYPLINDTALGYALVGRVDTCVGVPHLQSDELQTVTNHTDDEQLMLGAMTSLRPLMNEPVIDVSDYHLDDEAGAWYLSE